ncbi:hypothetical protein JR316_0012431 [Psilocybe cubensis]|uniref:Uncharacterized protein n=1 Tax=Psilocybe cubensis TaxID=181762 RepID=A0ACB8GIP3_PSICU|nr:hypothetical protein JR316_0012431 [Psilocybe cubensis]KAH9475320.1 hypothetical protein JR316_0012431 [Psilocybe cubensis]
MAALSYAVSKAYSKMSANQSEISDNQTVGAIITAVNSMMGRQEISQPQVMSYLVGGGDHYTSHKFAILKWHSIRRFCMSHHTKSNQTPNNSTLDDVSNTNEQENEESVELNMGDRDITASNQRLDYCLRPANDKFIDLCLYDFVAWGIKQRYTKEMLHIETAVRPGSFLNDEHPEYFTHYMTIRRKSCIPIILGPSIPNPLKSDQLKDDWARDMLLLFKPWRDISDLKTPSETWTDAFHNYEISMKLEHTRIIQNMQALTECSEARDAHRQRRRGKTSEDVVSDEVQDIILTDTEGNTDTLNPNDVYSPDPFQCIENPNEDFTTNLHDSIDNIGEETSRFLDMCLPLDTTETAVDTEYQKSVPVNQQTLTSHEVDDLLASHRAIMKSKRKRAMLHEPDTDDITTPPKRYRNGNYAPIAKQAILQDLYDLSHNYNSITDTDTMNNIAEEMGLLNNPEQLKAFRIIGNHIITDNKEQLLIHIAGVGGTGMSYY